MTRRTLLALAAGGVARAAKGRAFPSEVHRFADPTTEFPVERLTSPEHSCWLPAPHCRIASRRSGFMLYASDREGALQLFRLDHKSGVSLQLTDAQALDRSAFALLPGDRSALFFDGPSMRILALSGLRDREVYRVRDGWRRAPGLGLARDGSFALIIETRDGASEIRSVSLAKPGAETVVESGSPVVLALPRPGSAAILYRLEAASLWLADGRRRTPLATAPGRIASPFWRPDGETVLYLSTGEDGSTTIRENDPDARTDRQVAATTHYVHFAPNGDASVFVAASGSLAAPHVLLLLRVPRRELVLCEHRASDPNSAVPVFSPDSQRVYFQGDRDGRPAVYSVQVERLVEST